MPLISDNARSGAARLVHASSKLSLPARLPAVVVGGSLNGLGVVRSLSRARMPIYLLHTTRHCAAGWSRHARYVRVSSLGGRGLRDALLDLSVRLACRPVLILTSDESVNCVSDHRSEIEPLYRISLPSAGVVQALADKALFHELAGREGFAVPRTVCAGDTAGLAALCELTPPLIVKPADKTLALSGLVERALRAATLAEAQRAGVQMLACARRIVVQEWVDGPDTELFFTLFSCDRDGKLLGLFPGRKLACSPPAIGNTAVCVAAPEVAGELAALTLEFIARVSYRGLGGLEFKREQRSGRFLIIEPTVGRTDWQEEIATLCGMNLPLLTYFSELELRVAPAGGYLATAAWRSSVRFRASVQPGTRVTDGFLRWSDPLPALYHYGYERGLLRVWHKVSAAITRPQPVSLKD